MLTTCPYSTILSKNNLLSCFNVDVLKSTRHILCKFEKLNQRKLFGATSDNALTKRLSWNFGIEEGVFLLKFSEL